MAVPAFSQQKAPLEASGFAKEQSTRTKSHPGLVPQQIQELIFSMSMKRLIQMSALRGRGSLTLPAPWKHWLPAFLYAMICFAL